MGKGVLTHRYKVLILCLILSFSNCIPFEKSELDPNSALSLLNLLRLLNRGSQDEKLPSIAAFYTIDGATEKKVGFTIINPEDGSLRYSRPTLISHTNTELSINDFEFAITKDNKAENVFVIYKDFINNKYRLLKINLADPTVSKEMIIDKLDSEENLAGIAYSKNSDKIFLAINGGAYNSSSLYSAEGRLYVINPTTLSIEKEILIPIADQADGNYNLKASFYHDEERKMIFWFRKESFTGLKVFLTIISTSTPYEILNPVSNLSNISLINPSVGFSVSSNAIEMLHDTKNNKFIFSNLETGTIYSLYKFDSVNFNPSASISTFSGPDSTNTYGYLFKSLYDTENEILYHLFNYSPDYKIHKYSSQNAAQINTAMTISPDSSSDGVDFAVHVPGQDYIYYPLNDPNESGPFFATCQLGRIDTNSGITSNLQAFINLEKSTSETCRIKKIYYFE